MPSGSDEIAGASRDPDSFNVAADRQRPETGTEQTGGTTLVLASDQFVSLGAHRFATFASPATHAVHLCPTNLDSARDASHRFLVQVG